jgi:hypothetical protein
MRLIRASPKSFDCYNHIYYWKQATRLTFEYSAGILFGEGEESSGCLSELGKGELGSPDFLLASKSVGTDESQSIETRTS